MHPSNRYHFCGVTPADDPTDGTSGKPGIHNAWTYFSGRHPIRDRLGKSQSEFALLIGVSVSTLRNWEQGRRSPEGPARALLMVASENPEAVAEALG